MPYWEYSGIDGEVTGQARLQRIGSPWCSSQHHSSALHSDLYMDTSADSGALLRSCNPGFGRTPVGGQHVDHISRPALGARFFRFRYAPPDKHGGTLALRVLYMKRPFNLLLLELAGETALKTARPFASRPRTSKGGLAYI